MHIFRFAPITDPRLIAWLIGLVQGLGGSILNIRREVLEGAHRMTQHRPTPKSYSAGTAPEHLHRKRFRSLV